MTQILLHPAAQSIIIPLTISILSALILNLYVDKRHGTNYAVMAVSLGVLASYLAIFGLPPFPPQISNQKFFYIVILGAIIGLTSEHTQKWASLKLYTLFSIGGLVWLTSPTITFGIIKFMVTLLPMLSLWVLTFYQLCRLSKQKLVAIKVIGTCAIGVSITAILGTSASTGQLGIAVTASTIGVYFVLFKKTQLGSSNLWIYAAAIPLLVLVSQIILFSGGSTLPLVPLLALLFSSEIISLGCLKRYPRKLIEGTILFFPLAISIGIAFDQ